MTRGPSFTKSRVPSLTNSFVLAANLHDHTGQNSYREKEVEVQDIDDDEVMERAPSDGQVDDQDQLEPVDNNFTPCGLQTRLD